MQFFDIKANKIYNFLYQMPLQDYKNQPKNISNKFPQQYDSFYNFYFNGKALTVTQIQRVFSSKPNDENLIIVKKKSYHKKLIDHQYLYDFHRDKIEEYLKETKQNNVKSIKQNAEFIFQKTIDGNFKFRAFEHYDPENQLTPERKKQLLNEIYTKICNDPSESIDVIDWSQKQHDPKIFDESAKKKLHNIEQKDEQNDQSEKSNQVKAQKSEKQKGLPVKKEYSEKGGRVNLDLHELMYITEHWRQIQAINKYLMKYSCDNPRYYEQAKIESELALRQESDQRLREKDQQI